MAVLTSLSMRSITRPPSACSPLSPGLQHHLEDAAPDAGTGAIRTRCNRHRSRGGAGPRRGRGREPTRLPRRRMPEPVGERAPPARRAALDRPRHRIGPALRVPGRGEYGKTCRREKPSSFDGLQRAGEGGAILGREADDHVAREVESGRPVGARSRCGARRSRVGRVGASRAARASPPTGAARADAGRPAGGGDCAQQSRAEVVDLDRREPHACDAVQLGQRGDCRNPGASRAPPPDRGRGRG